MAIRSANATTVALEVQATATVIAHRTEAAVAAVPALATTIAIAINSVIVTEIVATIDALTNEREFDFWGNMMI